MNGYGKELILDLHGCATDNFSEEGIAEFTKRLCNLIDMVRCEFYTWGYDTPEERALAPRHLAGISAIQFITTSNITIHTLDKMKRVYINVFSCKDFDAQLVMSFAERYWVGKIVRRIVLERL